MTKASSIVSPAKRDEDVNLAKSLRPRSFDEFIGQEQIVKQLKIALSSAKTRKELPEHMLFAAPPGTGKTTLGKIVASELNLQLTELLGTSLTAPGLYWAFSDLEDEKGVVLIDEFMKLKTGVPQLLNLAMEDYRMPSFTGMQAPRDLKPFVMITATTDFGSLPGPLRERFTYVFHLDYYEPEDLSTIVEISSHKLDVEIQKKACKTLGERARGTPRIANRLLKRMRDYSNNLTEKNVLKFLNELGIDEYGLDEWDRRYIKVLQNFGGGPIGLKTMAGNLSETEETILQIYEPYLMRRGLIAVTPRGRILLKKTLPWKR